MHDIIVCTRRACETFTDLSEAQDRAIDQGRSALIEYTESYGWTITEVDSHSYGIHDDDVDVRVGIWTPSADVVCLKCHGPTLKWGRSDNPKWKKHYEENVDRVIRVEPTVAFKCDKCGAPTTIPDDIDVSQLASLRDYIGRGDMQQTGGMCVALMVDDKMIYASEDKPLYFGVSTIVNYDECEFRDDIKGDLPRAEILKIFRK